MKKMKRRFLALLTSFFVIATMVPAALANDVESATFTIDSATAKAGEEVQISVSLENGIENGFGWVEFVVNYDKSVLTFKDATPGDAISSSSTISGYGFIWTKEFDVLSVGYDDFSPVNASGEVAVITFAVSEDAAAGEYEITLSPNGEKAFYDCNGATFDVALTVNAGKITVTDGYSDSGDTNVLTSSNFTGPSDGYFTTAGITVTPSATDLSFTVACDNACVVAKDNGDGTYTRLTGTAVEGGYQFTADSASDNIVVALKGDIDGDGSISITDAAQIKAAQLGKLTTLTALQTAIADLDGDESISITDAAQIKATQLGKLSLAW